VRLLAKPVRRPETSTTVVVLGDAAPEANALHEALPADPAQTARQAFADLPQDRIVLPDIEEGVSLGTAED